MMEIEAKTSLLRNGEMNDEMEYLTQTIGHLHLLEIPKLELEEPVITDFNEMEVAEILWRYSSAAHSCDLKVDYERGTPYAAPRVVASEVEMNLILCALRDRQQHHCYNLMELFEVFVAYFNHICFNTEFEEIPFVLTEIIAVLAEIVSDKDSLLDFQRMIRSEPAQFRELLACHKTLKLNLELDLQMLLFMSRVIYCADDIAAAVAHDHAGIVDRSLELVMQMDARLLDKSSSTVTHVFTNAVSFYAAFFNTVRDEDVLKMMLAPVCKLLLFILQYPKLLLQPSCVVVVYTLLSVYLDLTIRYNSLDEIIANVILALLVRNLSDINHEDYITSYMLIRSIIRIEEAMFWEKSNQLHTLYVSFTIRAYKSLMCEDSHMYREGGKLYNSDTGLAFRKIEALLDDHSY